MPHQPSMQAHKITSLRQLLGDAVITQGPELDRCANDSSRYVAQGTPMAVVMATSTKDVSTALAWANTHRVPVSVRGAGTGLAGGAVAYANGLVISLERLDEIQEIDPVNRLAVVQAGVITAQLDRAAAEYGLFFPPDPASAEISTVGGNIATNAGGLRCIAHGVTRDSVAALEVVLADGTVVDTGARTIKNVAGLDLTSLFVGSEGTLGVITSATVRLKPVPPGTPRTFRASFDEISSAGEAVTAIVNGDAQPEVLELMDAHSVRAVEAFQPSGLDVPKAAVLIGQTVGLEAAETAAAIAQICEQHGAVEVVLAQDDTLLEARRLINPALTAGGLRVSCDVGVPIGELANMFCDIEDLAQRHDRAITFVAHAGDGNLHPTVQAEDTPEGHQAAEQVLDDIGRLAVSLGGTLTGEHGIGALKHHELPIQLPQAVLDTQRSIKHALDRHDILTPGRAI